MTVFMGQGLKRIVIYVALLNLGYFGIEFLVALSIGSVSLLSLIHISSSTRQ